MKIICYIVTAFLFASIANSEPTPIDAQAFSVTLDMTSLADLVAALDKELASRHRTVGEVMAAANRQRQSLCKDEAYTPLTTRSGSGVAGFCWESGDESVDYWYPQGVTTTHDASADGQYDDHQLVLNS